MQHQRQMVTRVRINSTDQTFARGARGRRRHRSRLRGEGVGQALARLASPIVSRRRGGSARRQKIVTRDVPG